MIEKTVYVDKDKRHLDHPKDGAIEAIEITAENGKVLYNPNVDGVWLSIAVDSVDGWTEIDEPNADEEATESDYITALQDLGVDVDA